MVVSFIFIFASNAINLEVGKFIGNIGIRRKLTQRICAPLEVIILLLDQTQSNSDINVMHYTSLLILWLSNNRCIWLRNRALIDAASTWVENVQILSIPSGSGPRVGWRSVHWGRHITPIPKWPGTSSKLANAILFATVCCVGGNWGCL